MEPPMRPGCSDSECGRAKIRRLLLTLSSLSAVRHNLLSLETLEDPHRSFSLEPGQGLNLARASWQSHDCPDLLVFTGTRRESL